MSHEIARTAVLAAKAAVLGQDSETARDVLDHAIDEVVGETWATVAGETVGDAELERIHGVRKIAGDVTVAVTEALRQHARLRDEETKVPSQVDPFITSVFTEIVKQARQSFEPWRITRVDESLRCALMIAENVYLNLRQERRINSAHIWTGLRIFVPQPISTEGATLEIEEEARSIRTYHPLWPFTAKTYAPIWYVLEPYAALRFAIQALDTRALVEKHQYNLFLYLTGWSYRL